MKKLFLLFLAMVMSLSLVACGANNDENNAAMQVKVDEAVALGQEVITWYEDNGYLEGDSAAEVQPLVDTMTEQLDVLTTAHQKFLDEGGYDDDLFATKSAAIDTVITSFQEAKDGQIAYNASEEVDAVINVLIEKYNVVVGLVGEASVNADETGWSEDEAFMSEHTAALAALQVIQEDLQNPDTMSEEYINELSAVLDELIPIWQDYATQVSEPYTK